MIYLKVETQRNIEIPSMMNVALIASLDLEVLSQAPDVGEAESIAAGVLLKHHQVSGQVEIARVEGLLSTSFAAVTIEGLGQALQDMSEPGQEMDLYGETYEVCHGAGTYLATHGPDLGWDIATPWVDRAFIGMDFTASEGVNISALLPHMLKSLQMLQTGEGVWIIAMDAPNSHPGDRALFESNAARCLLSDHVSVPPTNGAPDILLALMDPDAVAYGVDPNLIECLDFQAWLNDVYPDLGIDLKRLQIEDEEPA